MEDKKEIERLRLEIENLKKDRDEAEMSRDHWAADLEEQTHEDDRIPDIIAIWNSNLYELMSKIQKGETWPWEAYALSLMQTVTDIMKTSFLEKQNK